MKKAYFLKTIFFIFLLFGVTGLFSKDVKNVLILNSYHKGYEFSDTIIKGIEKVFYNNDDINTNIVYMNSKQIATKEYISVLNRLYSVQFKNKKYDLIIAIDKFAYKFIVKNYKYIFKTGKILFIGVEQYSKELARLYNVEDKLNGMKHRLAIYENVKLMQRLMPRLKKLYILNDRSYNSDDTSEVILKIKAKFKNKIEITYLRDDTLKDLKEYFKEYKKNEALLFIRFSNDLKGGYYRSNEVATAINRFKLPVFSTDTLFLGKGIIGGNLISIDEMGSRVGYFAIDLLENNKQTGIETYNSYKKIFDFNKLKEFNIKIPLSMSDYSIINAPKTFFQKYETLINSVFLGVPLLLVIIFGLLDSLHKRKILTKELSQRLEFEEALLNAIDFPIYWKNSKDIILDANEKFCKLLDLPYKDIAGTSLESLKEKSVNAKKIMKFTEFLYNKNIENLHIYLKDSKKKKKIYLLNQTNFKSSNEEDAVVTIFTDITKEQEIKEEKEKHTQYMIQQSKMVQIGEVFSSIAHQWKSPLVTITAIVQDMFYSDEIVQKEEDNKHIKDIMVQANYMTDTINEFQDFIVPSKEKKVFNAFLTIEHLLNIVKHNLKYNYIDIKLNYKKNSNLSLYGYENEFMQALLNIINNAKDALLNNSLDNRKLELCLKNKYKTLVIDITDNGPGLEKEDINKIFKQYFTTKKDGHGIGLYMTRLIIEDKMNGKISCKKQENGLRFRIILKTYDKDNDENISS